MTIEEAEIFMFGLKNYQWQQHPLLYKHVELGLKMVYDDFESRVCGECRYLKDSFCTNKELDYVFTE